MATFLVVSVVGPSVVVASDYEEDQFVEASENVDVWERAPFAPLYVDYQSGDPKTVVEHPEPVLGTEDSELGDSGMNRYQTGVWNTGQTIPLVFEDRSAATTPVDQFQGHEWDLIAARTDAGSLDISGIGSMMKSKQALELLDEDAEAEFEKVESREFDGASETFEYQPDQSGEYTFFLVKNDSVQIDDGDITDVSDAKVIGVDTTLVQDAEASIEPEADSYEPGDELSFDVSANHPDAGDEELFTHAVLLFDEEDVLTMDGAGDGAERVRLEFGGTAAELADAEASDFTLDTSFGSVEGVVRTDGDANAFGHDFDERNQSGKFDVGTLLEMMLEEGRFSEMGMETGESVLNASLTVVRSTDGDTTVTVGTTENFADGEYDVLYVAEGRDTGALSTARDTVTIESDATSTPGGGPPPWVPGPPVGPGPSPPADPTPGPAPQFDVQPNENAASIAFENVAANTPRTIDLPGVVGTQRATIDSITLDTATSHPGLEMSVQASDTLPNSETPALDIGEAISYVEVTAEAEREVEYNGAEFAFEADGETLQQRGIAPEDVRLFRFNEDDGEWQQLPTEHEGGNSYTATTPGFSVFAIGAAQQESALDVTEATVDEDEIETGETVEVTATVENTGDAEDTFTVDFTVDDEVVDSTDVTLDSGERIEVAFEHTFEETGSYDLAVGGMDAGTVEVAESDDPGQPVEEGFVSPGIVLVVVLVLVVLGGGAAYYARSSDSFDVGR